MMQRGSQTIERPRWIAPTALVVTLGGAAAAVAIWAAPIPDAFAHEPTIQWTVAGAPR